MEKDSPTLDELLEKCDPKKQHEEIFTDRQGKELL